jgi:GT2 family glycosyltransferase
MSNSTAPRPAVSVVVPFRGDHADAEFLRGALARLRVRDEDELIVADNSERRSAARLEPARVIPARAERSSYHARNVGSRQAVNEWILFIDADCLPEPDLLDAYFSEPVPERCGLVAGAIAPDPDQSGLLAEYARSRDFYDQRDGVHGLSQGSAATGNLLVRASAFREVGGFAEGIRSGGDIDLCWRIQNAGWSLEWRPRAQVVHAHRERLLPLLGAIARYAAGARWLNERYPGSSGRWPLAGALAGAAGDAVRLGLRGQRTEAAFKCLDGLGLLAHNIGYAMSNRARRLG